MTRKRARKLLMALGMSRNRANYGLTIKPESKTNAGVVRDILAIKALAHSVAHKMMEQRAHCCEPDRVFKTTDERSAF